MRFYLLLWTNFFEMCNPKPLLQLLQLNRIWPKCVISKASCQRSQDANQPDTPRGATGVDSSDARRRSFQATTATSWGTAATQRLWLPPPPAARRPAEPTRAAQGRRRSANNVTTESRLLMANADHRTHHLTAAAAAAATAIENKIWWRFDTGETSQIVDFKLTTICFSFADDWLSSLTFHNSEAFFSFS